MSENPHLKSLVGTLADADPFQNPIVIYIAIAFGAFMALRIHMTGQKNPCTALATGQLHIVTGATGPIGFEICRDLCRREATVLMACRDRNRGELVAAQLRAANPAAIVKVAELNLSSLAAVREFAASICANEPVVHCLIHAASYQARPQDEPLITEDGFDASVQINCLGAILLTELLRERLQQSGGRVVYQSANAHERAEKYVRIGDPFKPTARTAYAVSKLLVLLAAQAQAKLPGKWTVNCCTPGAIVRGTSGQKSAFWFSAIVQFLRWSVSKTPEQAAQTALYLASEPALSTVTGKYFNDCDVQELSAIASEAALVDSVYIKARLLLSL